MSEATDLSPLFDLMENVLQLERVATGDELKALTPPLAEFALLAGWLKPAALLTEWACTACDEPHLAHVDRNPGGGYSYLCLHNGRLEISKEQLQTYRPDIAAAVSTLAACISGKSRTVTTHVKGKLYKLGFADQGDIGNGWTLGFARGSAESTALADVLEAVQSTFPKGPGLIAVWGARPTGERRYAGYLFADAARLFVLRGGKAELDRAGVQRLLSEAGARSAKTGRKSLTPGIAEIRRELMESGRWPAKRSEQVTIIIANWCRKARGDPPAKSSLPRNLVEIEKLERQGRSIC
jgi:hypothetical protein